MPGSHSQNKKRPFLVTAQTGCLLPLFIILNLFFGWIFLGLFNWIIVGILLVLIFIIKFSILARKIISSDPGRDEAIDIKGEVVQDAGDKSLT